MSWFGIHAKDISVYFLFNVVCLAPKPSSNKFPCAFEMVNIGSVLDQIEAHVGRVWVSNRQFAYQCEAYARRSVRTSDFDGCIHTVSIHLLCFALVSI